MQTQYSAYRWIVLIAYMLVVAVVQMLWLNFAPVTDKICAVYQVSPFEAGMLTIIFSFVYILLSIPSGLLIDRYGYKRAISLSCILMFAASLIRLLPDNFYWLLLGQFGIALAQPFIMNSISSLLMDWFPANENSLVTGLSTCAMFAGMILGMIFSPLLTDLYGLKIMLMISAFITLIISLIFIVFAKANKNYVNVSSITSDNINFKDMVGMLTSQQLIVLYAMSFFALGIFNTIMTWLQPMLSIHHINDNDIGLISAAIIGCGVAGSAIIPAFYKKLGTKKQILMLCVFISLIVFYLFFNSTTLFTYLIYGGLFGFIFLPGYAFLLLFLEEEVTNNKLLATATSVLLMLGNLGGVVLSLLTGYLQSYTNSWSIVIKLLFVLLLFIFVLAARLRNEYVNAG